MEINNGIKLQFGGLAWSNQTKITIYFPISFNGYYAVVATDVGSARLVYATGHVSTSYFHLYSINADNIGCRWLAIGY